MGSSSEKTVRRAKSIPLALFCADIHLQHTVPPARSPEPDWYEAMARPLRELRWMAEEEYRSPVFIAGDVIDRWNSPPELINFAMRELPRAWSIPGQHDLPHHNLEEIDRSAYNTLVRAEVLGDLSTGYWDGYGDHSIEVHGVPFGSELPKLEKNELMHVLLHHAYIGQLGAMYPGAEVSNVKSWEKKLRGWDLAVFGDNHIGFDAVAGGCRVVNCGCLIRRKSDERKLTPSAVLLLSSGETKRIPLASASEDLWLAEEVCEEIELAGLEDFLDELKSDATDSLDFREAVNRYMDENGTERDVREIILDSIEGE